MSVVSTYLAGLKQAFSPEDLAQFNLAHGASPEALEQLLATYPLCPPALLQLLREVDGTHYRTYPGGEICILMLGSDMFEYPYFLSSVEQMLEKDFSHGESIADIYDGCMDEFPELIGPGIDPAVPMGKRLCFSNCMNNGGTSMLYIDFDPAPGGTVGQVLRFVHDPDNYEVIAPSFEEYLQRLIDEGYAFVREDDD